MTGTTGKIRDGGADAAVTRSGGGARIVVATVLAGAMSLLDAAAPGESDWRRAGPDRAASASGDDPPPGDSFQESGGVCGNCV
ncbi:hypothetical protein [Plantactinospora endophytica]|uniref:Uncharacterized protein n=1 Tax=Plantactinospora endophytica TaxID=673535 RepID=A0ABQ4DVB2_9ACTN|nr:hypothetical protein [Plantactinospora endophytica]GIG86398.1 hypothetical protein Pen02_13340 [Plantactinospora endophytica]